MKAGRITLLILVLGTSLSGCGQKGPLYHDAGPTADTQAQADAQTGAAPVPGADSDPDRSPDQ